MQAVCRLTTEVHEIHQACGVQPLALTREGSVTMESTTLEELDLYADPVDEDLAFALVGPECVQQCTCGSACCNGCNWNCSYREV